MATVSLLSCAHADRGRLPGLAAPDFRDGCGNQGAQGQRLDDRYEKELAGDFTKETGNQVSFVGVSPGLVEQRIKAGEVYDLVISEGGAAMHRENVGEREFDRAGRALVD